MRWPWKHAEAPTERLAYSLSPGGLAWAVADTHHGSPTLLRFGVQRLPAGDDEAGVRSVRALGLPPVGAIGVMPLTDYQMLQIEAPAVPPEELKSAARWRIKDMVARHVDELTLDVMLVGSPQGPARQQLFVVAAANDALKTTSQLAQAAGLQTQVLDIVDTAQRNLQTRMSTRLGTGERATAGLMRHGGHCLLTICIGDELCYSRRLDWDAALIEASHQQGPAPAPATHAHELVAEAGLQWVSDASSYDLGVQEPEADTTPRLVIELQRSFDVWERSWPEQPLAQLLIHLGTGNSELASYLQLALGLRVQPMNLALALPGAEQGGQWDGPERACIPLLGALLRDAVTPR